MTTTHTLDARGLGCPLPILRTKKALSGMDSGEVLEVTSTDPGSRQDIASFCRETGHQLLSSESAGSDYIFRISRA